MEIIKTEAPWRAVLIREEDPDFGNPRDFDNLGVFWAGNHSRYELGDAPEYYHRGMPEYEQATQAFEHYCENGRGGWKAMARYLRMVVGATHVLPVYLYDHSGLSVKAGQPGTNWVHAKWDSGVLGVIFDTPRTREYTGAPLESIEQQLVQEVEMYNVFLSGDVWIAQVEQMDESGEWNLYDSIGGILGEESAREEVLSMLTSATS